VLCSGSIGDHGVAVMLAGGDLALDADLSSDTAPLDSLVESLLGARPARGPMISHRGP
jgi:hydrogenase expression/formation protein HypE